ncbi:hypothetical protein DTL21_06410 [Bremerella cremea]|uniref:Tyr recombinase domain-containing protein n=1 Tax=Blastopirellula marina TaxID=124 RepID=A0A2S8FZG2_9BACT|nr:MULTISPECIES: tyrosine-type recombinase/integrase [Pirellulaceae]PQO37573.1 hypothetical protein C5Y83_06410 [Blastopirellula marina]RCS49960.1 hypothetical protein DTL21_06410 [Bremerella cremea]
MAKISVWIAKRKPNGTTKSGRTAWKTEAFRFKNEIAKDPDARVLVFWKVGRRNGEKLMEATGENGWRQAVKFRDEKLKELLAENEIVPEGRTAWKTFRAEFEREKLQATGTERLANLTVRDYRQLLDRLERLINPKTVEALDDKTVAKFRSLLMTTKAKQSKDGKLGAGSVSKYLRYFRSLLNFARKKGYSVANTVEQIKTWPSDTRYLPDESLQKIFGVLDSAKRPVLDAPYSIPDWWRGFLWLMRSNGLRLSEALNLRWENVSLDNATILLPTQKNGQSTTLPISVQTAAYLRKLVDLGEEFVFPTGGLHEKALYEEWHAIQSLAGVNRRCLLADRDPDHTCTESCQYFGFHSLRKAFCSINAQNGMALEVLCALARHSSVAVTQRFYLDAEALRMKAAGTLADPKFETKEPTK